ncbi:phosphoadenosine phosphosulfate reductase family protein [uncultured Clostridium sp.]|nr:phosphoadenosine phosphosulfate reductase family protein [uncultured Clostridium sp.]
MLQALPLDLKVAKTKLRIRDAITFFGQDGIYLSFSGGKDSTVLHHLVAEVEYELWGELKIPRVFCDTGLEYPELKAHVLNIFKTIPDNLGIIIRPTKSFRAVLTDYGYPVLSKSHSFAIRKLTKQNLKPEYRNKILWGDERGTMGRLPKKFHHLQNADYDISEQCCDIMKKKPFDIYEKTEKRSPMIGVMADESALRRTRYIKDGGCNAFGNKRPQSKPIGFWKEQDVLSYIYLNNIKIPSIYGDVQESFDLIGTPTYSLTGVKRTGCMWCILGSHLENPSENRFIQMKKTHPKLYNYCINGGEYNKEGRWIPSNSGLGIGHVLDSLDVQY